MSPEGKCMDSCQKMELTIKRVHWTHLTKDIFQLAGVQLAGAAECPRKMPSWSLSALWEPDMPGVRHECAPLTAVPNQGVGSIWVFVFFSSLISCVQVLAQCLTISQIIWVFQPAPTHFYFYQGFVSLPERDLPFSLLFPINLPSRCVVLVLKC